MLEDRLRVRFSLRVSLRVAIRGWGLEFRVRVIRRTFSPQNAMLNGETKPSLMHGKKPAEGKSKKKRGVGVQKDKSKTHFPRSKVKGRTGGTTSGDRG